MKFEGLNNTRDLGGFPAADGRRIKTGRLIRSGRLVIATPADIALLEQAGVTKVFDFRSEEERLEKPDPEIRGAVNLHLPTVRDMAAGITRDERSDGKAIDAVLYQGMAEPGFAVKYMCAMYESFVSDEYARSQYARFVQEIASNETGAALWHCNAGKDRAGFAAVILLEILGADRQDIIGDYLKTNEYIAGEVDELIRDFVPADASVAAKEAVRLLFSADEAFLNALYAKTDQLFGSFEGFLRDGLGVDDAMRVRLREMYLE
ncbi:MAG: tyrosine-protein phosphatase [Ruminococcus sp.]|nr:tyrosine-protein phosphatase [Ruminococcus sp.]